MEKDKSISEDQLKNLSEKIQKTTDIYTKKADEILDTKSKGLNASILLFHSESYAFS
jgi:ribosome recycling factor